MATTSTFRRAWRVILAGAPLVVGTGAVHAEGMMRHGMMGMGMMGDGDAKLTKEQFMQRSEQHFAHMDANKGGVIDATDRAAMRKRMHDCMHKDGDGAHSGTGSAEEHHPKP